MNQEVEDKLLWRATIIENVESLVKSCSRNDKAQLSLFAEVERETISLKIPENVNYDKMIEKEADILGVSLTYNIYDRYILHYKKFCNHTLRSINELTESSNKLVFIAKLQEIEYRLSATGNNYAKIFWKDYDSVTRMYLFGKTYQQLISRAFKGQYYLCEATYNKDKESLSIDKFRALDEIEIKEFVSTIVLYVDSPESAFELRHYIFNNMIGFDYNVIFIYKGDEFKAPYKIKFNEDHYLDIKDLITNIEVKNDR